MTPAEAAAIVAAARAAAKADAARESAASDTVSNSRVASPRLGHIKDSGSAAIVSRLRATGVPRQAAGTSESNGCAAGIAGSQARASRLAHSGKHV